MTQQTLAPRFEEALKRAAAEAQAAWPDVRELPGSGAFVEHLASLLPPGADPVEGLMGLHLQDLYLARACAGGDPKALHWFEKRFLSHVGDFVAQIDGSGTFVDELRQVLREHLLLPRGDGSPPKIGEYTGRGPLGAWLRVVAVRQALNLRRGRRVQGQGGAGGEAGGELRAAGLDPEMDYLKARYRKEFREAFQDTLTSLSPDERNVLRLHHLDGMSLDEIAALYKVHRATAARWLARTRESILSGTLQRMTDRLHLQGRELESIMGLVQSQLDVSVQRYLKGKGPADP